MNNVSLSGSSRPVPDAESQKPEQLQTLLEQITVHNPDADLDLIERAYYVAAQAHAGQFRKSGKPYLEHCVAVTRILGSLQLDSVSLAAGLLHDVLEDTPVTPEQLLAEFGEEITVLVDGVTKISGFDYKFESKEHEQAEYFHKMLLSIARDVRVILIKLADRLHNMRTLQAMPRDKRRQIALETRDIYAPLAHRFGIAKIKWELEDLCLKYLDPASYQELEKKIGLSREAREQYIERIKKPLQEELEKAGLNAIIIGRAKHFYSIYNKMRRRGLPFEEIYDLLAIRVITDSIPDCYHILGIINNMYKPIPDRIKDYIATPKSNMYRSLHTTIFGPGGEKVEIQIRTKEMDRVAEFGIAAHWLYKEGRTQPTDLDRQMGWLRQVFDWQDEAHDPQLFMDYLKIHLFENELFVFTPKGELKQLPRGATPLDFAFTIHTDIGLHCVGAKVNGKMVPLSTPLKSGDTVEIITSGNQKPSYDWLEWVKTSKAASKIRSWLRQEMFAQSVSLGRELFEKALKKAKLKMQQGEDLVDLANSYGFADINRFYAAIGRGELSPTQAVNKLVPAKPQDQTTASANWLDRLRHSVEGVKVRGVDNLMIRFAQCCQPVPGDNIVGFITRGRGISIHRTDCPNSLSMLNDPDRRIEVDWDAGKSHAFLASITIFAADRPGLLNDISRQITKTDSNITNANISTREGLAEGKFVVQVRNVHHLRKILKRIRRIKGIVRVGRQDGFGQAEPTED